MTDSVWVSSIIKNYNAVNGGLNVPNKIDYIDFTQLSLRRSSNQLSFEENERWKKYVENSTLTRLYFQGSKFSQEQLPNKLIMIDDEPIPDDPMIVISNRIIVLNQEFVNVLSSHNVGENQLKEIFIYDLNNQKILDKPFYFINFVEIRNFFLPQYSNRTEDINKLISLYEDRPVYSLYPYIKDDDYALDEEANNCRVDIWIDPNLNQAIFFSQKLVNSLSKVSITPTDLWLTKCNMIKNH